MKNLLEYFVLTLMVFVAIFMLFVVIVFIHFGVRVWSYGSFIDTYQEKPYCITEMAHNVEYNKCYKVIEVPYIKEGE